MVVLVRESAWPQVTLAEAQYLLASAERAAELLTACVHTCGGGITEGVRMVEQNKYDAHV